MPTIVELDVNSETEINVHTHTPEAALPIVVSDTRKWLDSLGLPGVTFEVKQVFGPAGGASVIEFSCSTERELRKLYLAYEGEDAPIGSAAIAEWLELVGV